MNLATWLDGVTRHNRSQYPEYEADYVAARARISGAVGTTSQPDATRARMAQLDGEMDSILGTLDARAAELDNSSCIFLKRPGWLKAYCRPYGTGYVVETRDGKPTIVILPNENGTPLERLAFSIEERFGVRTMIYPAALIGNRFDALVLRGADAWTVSFRALISGDLGFGAGHEVIHIRLKQAIGNSDDSLYAGSLGRVAPPDGTDAPSDLANAYDGYMSLDGARNLPL